MDTEMADTSEPVVGHPDRKPRKASKLPPLVLPDGSFYTKKFRQRLRYFTATSSAFKWDDNTINAKTKKFLARNGFHQLVWSGILLGPSVIIEGSIIYQIYDNWFKQNIVYISDDQFEATFGMPLDTTATITTDQLLANLFLLFALPAKSHSQYLHEWVQRRLDAFQSHCLYTLQKPEFDCHPELFMVTKRRFYVDKQLVPKLTRYAMDYPETDDNKTVLPHMFIQIRLAIGWSGLQVFRWSSELTEESANNYEAFELNAVKQDIQRLTAARKTIVDKYGQKDLPFARLLGYPEVSQLNHRHYPDLAFCAHTIYSGLTDFKPSLANVSFRPMATKTPINVLKAKVIRREIPTGPPVLTDEVKAILASMGIIYNEELAKSLCD